MITGQCKGFLVPARDGVFEEALCEDIFAGYSPKAGGILRVSVRSQQMYQALSTKPQTTWLRCFGAFLGRQAKLLQHLGTISGRVPTCNLQSNLYLE